MFPIMPYSVSTHHNPFYQGGWQSNSQSQSAEDATGAATFPVPFRSVDRRAPSIELELPAPPTASYTTFRFIPSNQSPSESPGSINCVILNPNNRIVYTITSESPNLTVMRDSHRRSVALIDWTSTISVDIRGGKGKKPANEWLMHDPLNPQVSSSLF